MKKLGRLRRSMRGHARSAAALGVSIQGERLLRAESACCRRNDRWRKRGLIDGINYESQDD